MLEVSSGASVKANKSGFAVWLVMLIGLLLAANAFGQSSGEAAHKVRVALIKMPYQGERNVPELSGGPAYLEAGGIQKLLEQHGYQTKAISTVALGTDEQKAYGEWNRLALANGDLGKLVAQERRGGYFPVGLLANCSALAGMLAGLQHSGPTTRPLRLGLVYVDAHGDFNTPETTLSGMLGGMPVAIASGMALTRMRLKAGLDPPIAPRNVAEACVRDTDPLEQDLLDRSQIQQLSVADIRTRSEYLRQTMERLSRDSDVIYVHIDMDALDPREVPGHHLRVPGGPTSMELANALTEMFHYEKAAAFGVASTPYGDNDKTGVSRQAAYNLIMGALKGVEERSGGR
jgi:arginase